MTDIDALLARMTWSEKLAQLQILWRPHPAEQEALAASGIGALFWPGGPERTNELQRIAMEQTRLGIPLLIGLDVVHGQFTIFPTPLAQAASFDLAVAEADARVSAAEARSCGVNWTFSPMVDVSRDPRWGRSVEGFGESPHLTSAFARAKVRAYQGRSLADPGTLAACAKHFVAAGAVEAGRDYNSTDVSRRRLREVHLPPFRAAVDAGAASVMTSLMSLNGTPMHANRWLISDILKAEYGFSGVVVSDADGTPQLVAHGTAATETDAVAASLGAGIDVVMGGPRLGRADGDALLGPGDVDPVRVDDAVRRVLRLKEALGLFDNPYTDPGAVRGPDADARTECRRAATRCVVLLRNEGALLPLAPSHRRILLTGPYAESCDHLGAWVQRFGLPAESLADALPRRFPEVEWTVLPGASFLDPSAEGIDDVRRSAPGHDLVIVAVGEPSDLSGEAASRSDLRLPGDQEALIEAVAATGVPFVVVVIAGRPLVVEDWIERAPSVLFTFHLGTEAPGALAEVIAGDAEPAGRLPMTIPRSAGQVPVYLEQENTGRPARTGGSLRGKTHDVQLEGPNNLDDDFTSKYLDLPLGPRFAFGHGSGYTSFALGEPACSAETVGIGALEAGATITVGLEVANTGARDGENVLLLYVHDPVASVAQPVRRLAGFHRVAVRSGERETVSFTLDGAALTLWDDDERAILEPGRIEVILTDGTSERSVSLELVRGAPGR